MNLWERPGVPHKGWTCLDVEDHEEPGFACDMCGNPDVRYVHVMEHPDFPTRVLVGCVCAGRMEQDYEAPRRRERDLINRAQRREKWLTRRWRVSWKGNQYLNLGGRNVGVGPDHHLTGLWYYRIEDQFSRARYQSADSAKLALFEALNPTRPTNDLVMTHPSCL